MAKESKQQLLLYYLVLVYFMVNGQAAYVLPRFEDTIYIQIEKGDHFGIIDMVYDPEVTDYIVNYDHFK